MTANYKAGVAQYYETITVLGALKKIVTKNPVFSIYFHVGKKFCTRRVSPPGNTCFGVPSHFYCLISVLRIICRAYSQGLYSAKNNNSFVKIQSCTFLKIISLRKLKWKSLYSCWACAVFSAFLRWSDMTYTRVL